MAEEKFINRVQALLTLSMEGSTEGEREAARLMADKLILSHQIDRSLLSEKTQKREGIVKVYWNIPSSEYWGQLSQLVGVVMRHCKIRAIWEWAREGNLSVIGFESDVEYAQMLWINVYAELAGHLYPKWDTSKTFDENVYNHVKGGIKWGEIHRIARENNSPDAPERLGGKYKGRYQKECARRGEEPTQHTQRHEAFRASYAQSFAVTINRRLRDMREAAEDALDADHSSRYAVALVDNEALVDAEFYRLFPQHHPDYIRDRNAAEQAAEALRRSELTPEQLEAEDKARAAREKRDRAWHNKYRDKEYDSNGWAQGVKVGNNVDLSMGRNHVQNERHQVEA